MKILVPLLSNEVQDMIAEWIRYKFMAKSASYSAYDQVAVPSAGGTNRSGKDSANCDDALGKPGSLKRNETTVATPDSDSELCNLREKQLGSNGYQSNGFHKKDSPSVAPRRGFKITE